MPSVLIMDDHRLVLESLKAFLESDTTIDIHAVGTHKDALAKIKDHGPFDCVLADLHMPEKKTAFGLSDIVEANNPNPVFLFSGVAMFADIYAAKMVGVAGHIRKDMPAKELAALVERVVSNPGVIPSEIRLSPSAVASKQFQTKLSEEDCVILGMVSQGARNSEIASGLGIPLTRVEGRLRSIYKAIGVTSRLAAAVFMNENAA